MKKYGSIEEGKSADIILLDLNTEVTNPIGTVFSDIVYNTKGSNVVCTIINGKIVMEDRQIRGFDRSEVFYKCEKIIERIR